MVSDLEGETIPTMSRSYYSNTIARLPTTIMNDVLNFLIFQWFFVRRVRERIPLIDKYTRIAEADWSPLTKENEYCKLVAQADDRPATVFYPPDLYDLLNVGFYEYRWVFAWPLTGWQISIRS